VTGLPLGRLAFVRLSISPTQGGMCRKSVRMWSNMLYYSSVWSDNGGKNSFPIVAGQSLKWPASSRVPGTAKFSPELCDSMHIKLPSHNHASVLRYQVSKCIYCKSAKKQNLCYETCQFTQFKDR